MNVSAGTHVATFRAWAKRRRPVVVRAGRRCIGGCCWAAVEPWCSAALVRWEDRSAADGDISRHHCTTVQSSTARNLSPSSLHQPRSPQGSADLRFVSPQPDTSSHCQTMDTGLVYRAVCPFTPQLSLVQWYSLRLPTEGWPGWVHNSTHGNNESTTEATRNVLNHLK